MIYAMLLLAGKGERANNEQYKQYIKIKDKELFLYSLDELSNNENIDKIVLVCNEDHLEYVKTITKKYNKIDSIIEGGTTRNLSVHNGLLKIAKNHDCDYVLIHDGARPLISQKIINDNIDSVKKFDSVATFIEIYDSIIEKNNDDTIGHYLKREKIVKIQTPQCFKFDIILKAHQNIDLGELNKYTDDAGLVMSFGYKIHLIRGDIKNFKITTENDLAILKKILE